ncbi:MAG: hypothetical protein LBV51_03365 [Acholeplasmatales bacterium]|jgi:chromosome segregation ATPase|nr:hypothetical protein [Acholeplasmatales bacterium]
MVNIEEANKSLEEIKNKISTANELIRELKESNLLISNSNQGFSNAENDLKDAVSHINEKYAEVSKNIKSLGDIEDEKHKEEVSLIESKTKLLNDLVLELNNSLFQHMQQYTVEITNKLTSLEQANEDKFTNLSEIISNNFNIQNEVFNKSHAKNKKLLTVFGSILIVLAVEILILLLILLIFEVSLYK